MRIGKASKCFDGGNRIWVADKLREVRRIDRAGDHVGAAGEIDHCWSCAGRWAALATSASG